MPFGTRPAATGVTDNASSGALTGATALSANNRASFIIQNQSTAKLYVKLGTGGSTSDYHIILPACTGAADGSSAPYKVDGYKGDVTVASSSLSYSCVELA